MASIEVRRGDFIYRDTLFAEVGENKRHPRASIADIKDQLLPKRGGAPLQDKVGHWYEAQLLHYGLPRTKEKNTAKMRLLQAITQGSLAVPQYLVHMETQMKKEYSSAARKATAGAKKADWMATDGHALPATKKRKQHGQESTSTKVRVAIGDVTFDIDHQSGRNGQPSAKKQRKAPSRDPTTPIPGSESRVKKTAPATRVPTSPATTRTSPATRPKQTARRSHLFSPTNRNDLPPPYEAYQTAISIPSTPSPPRISHSVVQISGYYPVTSLNLDSDESYITFRIDHRQDKLWGRFDIGHKTGIIMVNGIDSISRGDTTSFGWRSRDEEHGSLKFGRGCDGRIEFDGQGSVRGVFYGVLDGGDLEFEGDREYDDAPEADVFEEEWNDFPEIAYGRR